MDDIIAYFNISKISFTIIPRTLWVATKWRSIKNDNFWQDRCEQKSLLLEEERFSRIFFDI